MPTQFQLKRSSVAGVRPTTSNIQPGELAVNIQDGILFSANSTNVFEVGGKLTSVSVGNATSRFTANTTQFYANVPTQFISSFAVGNSSTNTTFVVNNTFVAVGSVSFIAPSTVFLSGTTQNLNLGYQQTTGAIIIGGPSQSGSINVGRSTNNQTLSIANGATTLGNTKTVEIGVGGVNGSITNILIGPNTAGVAGNTVIAGNNLVVTANTYLNGSLYANGALGTSGQILTSNGSGVYWSTPGVSSINTAAQYTWSNTHTFQNTVTFSTVNAIVLPVGNTASRPTAANGMIRYNTNTGLVEVVANSTWTGLMSAYSSVREQFTASNNQTTFTVTGGYLPGQVDVYYNGVKLRNGVEVTVSSGSTVVLTSGAANGALVEVVGTGPSFVISNTSQIVYQQYTATSNQTSFTVTNGYIPGLVDVFVDGIKMVNGTDVNVSSGTNVVLTSGIPNGAVVEVKGYSTPLVSAQTTTAVRQTFTANSTVNNNFQVSGGYIAGQIDVYLNGTKLVNGTAVNTSSGTNIVLTTNAASGAVVDVVGINYYTAGGGVTTPVRQTFVANSTVNTTFTVTSGYSPGQIDVYRNGVKMVPGTDVNISSGSTITLTTAAANGDTIEVVGFSAVSYADVVRKTGDNMTGNLTINNQPVATTGKAIAMAIVFG